MSYVARLSEIKTFLSDFYVLNIHFNRMKSMKINPQCFPLISPLENCINS